MNEALKDQRSLIFSGKPYNPLTKELSNLRKRAKALCYEYNQSHPDQKGKKQQILSKLFNVSQKPYIEPDFYCDYGDNISLGRNFYANHHCTILDAAKVTIGDNVLLGPNVTITTAGHPLEPSQRKQGLEQAAAITIGDNVWIGAGATILAGVIIADNSVVAAGAIVTENVAADSLVAGVPAKFVRNILDKP